MIVIKHDGRKEYFDENKIIKAVKGSIEEVYPNRGRLNVALALDVTGQVVNLLNGYFDEVGVDKIHDTVEKVLMKEDSKVAKAYIIYRQKRTDIREAGSELNKQIDAIEKEMHHDNANTGNCAASKMYGIAGLVEKNHNLSRMNPVHARNHKLGRIYIHKLNCGFVA